MFVLAESFVINYNIVNDKGLKIAIFCITKYHFVKCVVKLESGIENKYLAICKTICSLDVNKKFKENF